MYFCDQSLILLKLHYKHLFFSKFITLLKSQFFSPKKLLKNLSLYFFCTIFIDYLLFHSILSDFIQFGYFINKIKGGKYKLFSLKILVLIVIFGTSHLQVHI